MGRVVTLWQTSKFTALVVLVCLFPAESYALFFPFESVLETITSPKVYRTGEQANRSDRSDIVGVSISVPKNIPRLEWHPTQELERQWEEVKGLKKPSKQLREVDRRGLRNFMSHEVTPLTYLGSKFQERFIRRDTYRDRIYGSPEFFALFKEVIPLLDNELPEEQIMVGDVSQVGAGPLVFGTTVELLSDSLRDRSLGLFLEEAFLDGDNFVRNQVVNGQTVFPEEQRRWNEIEGPLWIEERLTGIGTKDDVTYGRIERRRFYRSGEVSKDELNKWWNKKKRSMKRRYHHDTKAIERGGKTIWRVRWVRGKTLFEGEFRNRVKRSPRLKDLLKLKVAQLAPKKPGSLQRERRYFMTEGRSGTPKIIAWRQLYEAGHISHLNGRDADLSYIMKKPELLFSRSVSHIDVKKTRRWFELLFEASVNAGVEIDALLVDRRVKRKLLRRMSEEQMSHPVWELLTVSKGHDSHVHIRLKPGFFVGSRNAFQKSFPRR